MMWGCSVRKAEPCAQNKPSRSWYGALLEREGRLAAGDLAPGRKEKVHAELADSMMEGCVEEGVRGSPLVILLAWPTV